MKRWRQGKKGCSAHAHRRHRSGSILVPGLVAALLLVPAGGAAAAPSDRSADDNRIPDRYIVVFRGSVDDVSAETDKREARQGFRAQNVYRRALKGFSAKLSKGQVERLEADPEVAFVSPDRKVKAQGAIAPGDSAPSGVRRIGAASASQARSASGANVAVIDTGIDLDHPDLNAAAGKNCIGSGPPEDDDGHGTHVAGSVAARNNGSGVIGVAPDTKVFAAKVLGPQGGSLSTVICGVDWATSTRTDSDATNDIAVANMSLGGFGEPVESCGTTTDALHKAICNSTAAGVDYVVAAGNNGWDFDFTAVPDVPAAYPEVLTVTAMSDSDGQPGGKGGACDNTGDADDDTATFSNFALTAEGQQHTIAGPGVCINSTWLGGGHSTISGTSMASPHVAGAVALCLNEGGTSGPCAGLTSDQVVQKVRADAKAKSDADSGYGFIGDPLRPVLDRFYGHLAWVGQPVDKTKPRVKTVSPASGATRVSRGANVLATFSERMKASTINKATVKLVRKGSKKAVPAVVSYNASVRRAKLNPKRALARRTTYTATVTTGAKDLAGNPLASKKSWSFRTRR